MRKSRCKLAVPTLTAPILVAAGCASPLHRSYSAHDAALVRPVSPQRLAEVRRMEAARDLAVVETDWD